MNDDNFNIVNVGLVAIGVLLILAAIRGDSVAATIGPLIGRNDIPKGTLKLAPQTPAETPDPSQGGTSVNGTDAPSKAEKLPKDQPLKPMTPGTGSGNHPNQFTAPAGGNKIVSV